MKRANIEKELPEEISLVEQAVDWKGGLFQSFTLTLAFSLGSGELIAADKALALAMPALPVGSCLDMGMPKKGGEWLLAGKAYSKEGKFQAQVHVGKSRRTFLIHQEEGSGEGVDLSWKNTWGNLEENPEGMPLSQVKRPPVSDAALDFGKPACPSAMGLWPCRLTKMGGTYDKKWISTRCPGLPDDFSWEFFNLAQSPQRLPEALRGGECIELFSLHPTKGYIRCTLPQKKLRFFVFQYDQWKEYPPIVDTVWLFPNQEIGLLLMHKLVPCKDEMATDIPKVRVVFGDTVQAPAPASVEVPPPLLSVAPPSSVSPKAVLTGLGIAGVTVAAVGLASTSRASSAKNVKKDFPKQNLPKKDALKQESQKQEDVKKKEEKRTQKENLSSGEQEQSLSARQADALQEFHNSIPEINAGLVKAGLVPLTAEQIVEVEQHIKGNLAKMDKIEAELKGPEPSLDDVLRQAGMEDKQIQGVKRALDLEPPDPEKYPDAASWEIAIQGYLKEFDAAVHPSQDVLKNMAMVLRLAGPNAEAEQKKLFGEPPSLQEVLVENGAMTATQASAFSSMLEKPLPESAEGFRGYLSALEQAGGFPSDSMNKYIDEFGATIKKYGMDKDFPELQELSLTPVIGAKSVKNQQSAGGEDGVETKQVIGEQSVKNRQTVGGEESRETQQVSGVKKDLAAKEMPDFVFDTKMESYFGKKFMLKPQEAQALGKVFQGKLPDSYPELRARLVNIESDLNLPEDCLVQHSKEIDVLVKAYKADKSLFDVDGAIDKIL